MRFSQRNGYSSLEHEFQRESVDEPLRVKLWNILKVVVWDQYSRNKRPGPTQSIDDMVKRIWVHLFNRDLDRLPPFYSPYQRGAGAYDLIKDHFMRCEWFEVYDLLEAIAKDPGEVLSTKAIAAINRAFEELNGAYRFVGTDIVEITNEEEIRAIEEALGHPEDPVRTHLATSLRMLSARVDPDYRNSVKESISAVEAACRLATGSRSATLSDALKKVSNLHPAFSAAFGKLYGYTSDAQGIRHSLIDEDSITYADAKFMLVACSAFVSYLNAAQST